VLLQAGRRFWAALQRLERAMGVVLHFVCCIVLIPAAPVLTLSLRWCRRASTHLLLLHCTPHFAGLSCILSHLHCSIWLSAFTFVRILRRGKRCRLIFCTCCIGRRARCVRAWGAY